MTDLSKLTPAERADLKAQLEAEERAEKLRKQNDRNAYKKLVNEKVNSVFPSLIEVSESLSKQKKAIYDEFEEALNLKASVYGIKETQQSHTFTNDDGDKRLTVGFYMTDNYDDTVNTGIEKVKAYIGSLAKDDDSRMLVDAIMKLLSKDQQGNLKASRVLQLSRMSEQSGNADFIEGVKIILEAYRPIRSKTYIKAEYKNEQGAWVNVPLGITEA